MVPTWIDINRADKSIAWLPILERPENLLNERFVDRRLAEMAPKKKLRVTKALNKLARQFKGLIPRRELPEVERRARDRKILRLIDLFAILQTLFATRKRTIVHLALDLYIILLSGQRFLADHK